ncbi:hypothetical protein ACFQL7_28025 [Halocatena marina]|uniref:Uncharacterized protein n=1 Tax=Halocatena marina TaxID=2934937 RepID=A0ABD5YVB9_9EURY
MPPSDSVEIVSYQDRAFTDRATVGKTLDGKEAYSHYRPCVMGTAAEASVPLVLVEQEG